MKFIKTKLAGVFIIELDTITDERGFFARSYDSAAFEKAGIPLSVVQGNISYNAKKGTLRGMHFQTAPHAEAKVVQCVRGAIYDVALDLRTGSPTYKEWVAVELSADDRRMMYIPEGCAHGFQTLANDTEVHYLMGAEYNADAARGIRYDDPAFAIEWPPEKKRHISERDRSCPDWSEPL